MNTEYGRLHNKIISREFTSTTSTHLKSESVMRSLYRGRMNVQARVKVVTNDIIDVRLDPTGSGRVLVGTTKLYPDREDCIPETILIDIYGGTVVSLLPPHRDTVSYSEFSCKGKYAVTASYDKSIKVWNVADGSLIWTFEKTQDTTGHSSRVFCIAPHHHTENIVASCGADRSVFIWDIREGLSLGDCAFLSGNRKQWPGAVEALTFCQGERYDNYLVGGTDASTSKSGMVFVWDVKHEKEVYMLKGHNSSIACVDSSVADGRCVLSAGAGDTMMITWDLLSGAPIHRFLTGQEDINVASFSPCGRYVQAAATDSTVVVFDRRFPNYPLHRLFINRSGRPDRPKTMTHGVMASQWTHQSSLLVTGGEDGCVRVWDVGLGRPLLNVFKTHSEPVTSIAINKDDTFFVSGGDDAIVAMYSLSSNAYQFNELEMLTLHSRT